jgi:hypothetical protein
VDIGFMLHDHSHFKNQQLHDQTRVLYIGIYISWDVAVYTIDVFVSMDAVACSNRIRFGFHHDDM